MSPRCVAGARCKHATYYWKDTKKEGRKQYWQGREIPTDSRVKCAHDGCDKYACCDNPVCLAALHYHYNLEHVCDPLLDLTAPQIHSLAHGLTYHFALDYDLDLARANHAIVSLLPDGLDCSQPGHSGRYNSSCSVCNQVLGAFAFQEDGGKLVCYPCTKDQDPTAAPSAAEGTNTVRLWSKHAMSQSRMLMEMRPPNQPSPSAMEADIPKPVDQHDYTERTHFTPEEVKAAWQPDPERKGDWKEDQSGNAQEAEAVATGKGKGKTKYLSSTLINFLAAAAAVWYSIRGAFSSGMMVAARGVNDIGRSTLIMLGGVGTGTGFHLDWTQASNVAFSVGATVVSAGITLAEWVFINPRLVAEADAWVKQHVLTTKRKRVEGGYVDEQVSRWPLGFASPASDRVLLIGNDLQLFLTYMRKLGVDRGIKNPVVEVKQCPGRLVRVPAGWPHQVTNVSPNVKVAWDYYDAGNMHKYVQLQSIAAECFKGSMAKDYMSFNMIMSTLVGNL